MDGREEICHIILVCQIYTALRIEETIFSKDNLDFIIRIVVRLSIGVTEFLDVHVKSNSKHRILECYEEATLAEEYPA